MRAGFEFKLLGPLEVSIGGHPVSVGAAKQRVVLASLLVDTGRVVTVDQLIAQLWDNSVPAGARATLRTYVMRLRQALDTTAGTGPIITCAEGYRIDLSGHNLDLHHFEALIDQAKVATAEGRSDRASVLLSDALGLWRGQPLSNVPSEVLHREVLPRLDERWLLARELCIDAALAVGRHQEMTAELGELTTRHPLRERFWAQRMLALYRSGRQAEALDCYRHISTLLAAELGINPGPELRSLHQAMLAANPRLQLACPDRGDEPVEFGGWRQLTDVNIERTASTTSNGSGNNGVNHQQEQPLRDGARCHEAYRPAARALQLLEREHELQTLAALIDAARRGSGQLVRVEGAAGVGKTRLLAAAREHAQRVGMRTLAARGSELEREFAYGVVRQLFERVLAGADKAQRDHLLAGAARTVAVLFDQVDSSGEGADMSFALLHGLFWLTANLAQSPLMLIIDDLHWSDRPSLRFLAYLIPRLEGLPLLLVVALRPAEPGADQNLLAQIATDQPATVVRPAPLSEAASAQLVRIVLGEGAQDAFCHACHIATGGNPLLLRELADAAAAEGLDANSDGVARLKEIGPQAVKRRVALRLARLGSPAVTFCGALAVLGDNAKLPHVAQLAGLAAADAAQTARQLADIEILQQHPRCPGEARNAGPISFVHPLVRAAVYEGLAEAARLDGHARAAHLLAGIGDAPERVAAHLLLIPPAGDRFVASTLCRAADQAFARGAPDSAVAYLERCVQEPPAENERADVLFALGAAAQLLDAAKSVDYLMAAVAVTDDPKRKAAIAEILGITLFNAGRAVEASQVVSQAIQALDVECCDLHRRLQALLIQFAIVDPAQHAFGAARVSALRSGPSDASLGSRMLDVTIAFHDLLVGDDTAIALARRGLDDGSLIEQANFLTVYGCFVLIAADLDEVVPLLDAWIAVAHRRGSVFALAPAKCFRGVAWLSRGALAEAEANLRDALWAVTTTSQRVGTPVIAAYLADTLMEQGSLDEAEAVLDRATPPEPLPRAGYWAWLLASRARLLALQGRIPEALQTWLACGRRFTAHGGRNPAVLAWRSGAALAMYRLGRRDEAQQLAAEEIALARRWGAPTALGHALRVAGLVAGDHHGLTSLTEAGTVLTGSPARLEQAKTLVDTGAALRRSGRQEESHQHLRRGIELAQICGATPLIEYAKTELRASGGRPLHVAPSGPDALTPSERRVAELATAGYSDRDIAQALFITTNTVETHLTATYHKLGIHGRADLASVCVSCT
ncbi:MAG TPA: BTAD domain-containing putative transcriptional regulator [Pseudonocardiaceae bacterium]|nr:BTAD domain-containing putative transcriptional regulator [Pseudonocardiaceae bacterium]